MPKVPNHHFYASAIKKYGISAKGVNWHSSKTQHTRFKVIEKLLPEDINEYTLVDAGCGFGDFYIFLQEKKKIPKTYIGIDIHSDMHSIASNLTGELILQKDICKDNLIEADFYICSGALNTLNKFEANLFIINCFKHSKKAFIFNVLYGTKQSATYNYMSKDEILNITSQLGVKEVKFYENYLEDDITVALYR